MDEIRWTEAVQARFGVPKHVDERLALVVLAAAGIDTGDVSADDVYGLLAVTRRQARAYQLANRWRYGHRSWGPVLVEGGWLYVLDLRDALTAPRGTG